MPVAFRLNFRKSRRLRYSESSLHEKYIFQCLFTHGLQAYFLMVKSKGNFSEKTSHFPVHVLIKNAMIMHRLTTVTNNNVIY